MIKKRIALLLCVLMAACAGGVANPDGQSNAIAVWNVENLWPRTDRPDLSELFSDEIIRAVNKTGRYRAVERKSLQLALQELNLGSSSLADESTRLRLGKIAGARWMIFGGYLAAGDHMRVDLRLVEVETGRVKKAAERSTASQDVNDWLHAVREAAEELL